MHPVSSEAYRFWISFGQERGHLNCFWLRQGDLRTTCSSATSTLRLEVRGLIVRRSGVSENADTRLPRKPRTFPRTLYQCINQSGLRHPSDRYRSGGSLPQSLLPPTGSIGATRAGAEWKGPIRLPGEKSISAQSESRATRKERR